MKDKSVVGPKWNIDKEFIYSLRKCNYGKSTTMLEEKKNFGMFKMYTHTNSNNKNKLKPYWFKEFIKINESLFKIF